MALELLGHWTLDETSADFDDYLRHMKFGYIARQFALRVSPKLSISLSDGRWSIVLITGVKTITTEVGQDAFGRHNRRHDFQFALNTEFFETTPDGRRVRASVG